MRYNRLGRTDLEVSEICLGTMTWGRQNDADEAFAQMDYALEAGINFLDTAELYAVPPTPETCGRTEEIIGEWLASRKTRDQIVLASKIAGPGASWIRDGHGIDGASIRTALEGSLKRLQTETIDLYQLHWPNRPAYSFGRHWDFAPTGVDPEAERENFLEVLETLNILIHEGKIRHAGLSNETAWGTCQYLRLAEDHDLPRMASIQNEYSLLYRQFEPDLAEIAMLEDIGLLAYSPLAAGALSGKYLDGNMPEGTRRTLLDGPTHRATQMADEAIRAYMQVADKHGMDICQMAIAFTLTRPFLTSCIIGATSMAQLKNDIAAAELSLGDEVLDDIAAIYKRYAAPF